VPPHESFPVRCPFRPCGLTVMALENSLIEQHNMLHTDVACPGSLQRVDPSSGVTLEQVVSLASVESAYENIPRQALKLPDPDRTGERRGPAKIGFPHGKRADYDKPGPYFPGRPADAPEPTPGEHPPLPPDVEGVRSPERGSRMSDSLHDQLRAVTNLAIEGCHQGVQMSHHVIDSVGTVDNEVAFLKDKIESVRLLAAAAAGSSTPPEAIREMTAKVKSAEDGCDEVQAALQLAVARLWAVANELAAASEKGTEYLGQISR
jgi:hypothetical protein